MEISGVMAPSAGSPWAQTSESATIRESHRNPRPSPPQNAVILSGVDRARINAVEGSAFSVLANHLYLPHRRRHAPKEEKSALWRLFWRIPVVNYLGPMPSFQSVFPVKFNWFGAILIAVVSLAVTRPMPAQVFDFKNDRM